MQRAHKPEPLEGHPKYEKVGTSRPTAAARKPVPSSGMPVELTRRTALHSLQIRDLNSGTFGFVQLARDKTSGELIAVKFIERGEKVSSALLENALRPVLRAQQQHQQRLCGMGAHHSPLLLWLPHGLLEAAALLAGTCTGGHTC